MYKEFFDQLDALREKYVDEHKDYCKSITYASSLISYLPFSTNALLTVTRLLVLHILVVSPTHQRQGLGSILVREGLAAADHDKARTYIEASPAGLELYKRFGWKEVEQIQIDMKPYGGTGLAAEVCLIREPGGGVD